MPVKKRLTAVVGMLVTATTVLSFDAALAQPEATLEGRALLPADTFAEGPSSGAELDEETKGGRTPPFEGQPVGGVSAVLDEGDGEYLAMADNGFGQKANSADFLLRAYYIRPDFETAEGGSGEIRTGQYVQLRDPDRHVPFEITNEESEDRLLTGADFDIESVRRDNQGNLWFGDEFGPFLLHTDASGRLLEAPIPLPGVKSPENPTLEDGEEPNLATSKGFEGMAISADGTTLYPVLEGALEEDRDRSQRLVYEFDINGKRYTGEVLQYRTETPDNSIGDLTPLGAGVTPSTVPLWRSPRAMSPLLPSWRFSCGRTCSRTWRNASSIPSGEPSNLLTRANIVLLLFLSDPLPRRVLRLLFDYILKSGKQEYLS
jgi:hypothetical protein